MIKRTHLDFPRPFHGDILKELQKLIRPQVSTKGRNREPRLEKRRDGSQWIKSWGAVTPARAGTCSQMAKLQTGAHRTVEPNLLSVSHIPWRGQLEVAPRGWRLHTHSLRWRPEAVWLGIICLRALKRPCGVGDREATMVKSVTAQYTQNCLPPKFKRMCLREDPFTHWPQKP